MRLIAHNSSQRFIGLLILLLLLINTAFLVLRIAGTLVPKAPIAMEVTRGLESAAFAREDYPANSMIGADQWTDCLAFEIALAKGPTTFIEALAPSVLSDPMSDTRCAAVVDYVGGDYTTDAMFDYSRFWHGYSTLMSVALQVMPLGTYRGLLTMLCYGAIMFVGSAAGLADRQTLIVMLPLLAIGLAGSAIYEYGALVSHSPAFIAMWTLSGLVLLLKDRLSFQGLLLFAATFGMIEAFLDAMILCPLSATLAIIFCNVAKLRPLQRASLREITLFNMGLVCAWSFGFIGTYISKLALTIPVLGFHRVIDPFISQLLLRMSPAGETPLSFLRALAEQSYRLAYAEYHIHYGEALVILASATGWACAVAAFVRSGTTGTWRGMLAVGSGFIIASLFVLSWFLVFPEHTINHAWVMVRVTIVWIAGGWCWLLAQRVLRPKISTLFHDRPNPA
jgi:hypothetical protein